MSVHEAECALSVNDLRISYSNGEDVHDVLRGVSFSVGKGETYGIVGESGCGKSTLGYSVVRYLAGNAMVRSGSIHISGRDVNQLPPSELRRLRARKVSVVYQNPGAALNPTIRIGELLEEAFRLAGVARSEARSRALAMLKAVKLTDPESVMKRFAHQLSGGMQQRVVIAMALAKDPELLILDEPTTGLDATVEAEVLDLVGELQRKFGTAVLLISHNIEVVRRVCARVGVLYGGRIVEEGATNDVLERPSHPYTAGLLGCLPQLGVDKRRNSLHTIPGHPPEPSTKIAGCLFAERCPRVEEVCRVDEPQFTTVGRGHRLVATSPKR